MAVDHAESVVRGVQFMRQPWSMNRRRARLLSASLVAASLAVGTSSPGRLAVAAPAGTPAPARPAAPSEGATDLAIDPAALKSYQTLFGAEEKRVAATGATKDDAQFASSLIEKAKSLTDDPALVELIYNKAYEFGIKDPDGFPAAAQALAKLGEHNAIPKLKLQEKRVELARLRVKRGNAADRAEAGNWLVDELTAEADRYVGLREYAEALKRYNEAATVASQVRSPRLDDVRALVKDVQGRLGTKERLDKLLAQLTAKPDDARLAQQVVNGYLLELDDPAAAAKLPPAVVSAETQRMAVLAARDPQALADDDHLKLAQWYKSLAADKAVPAAGRATALSRAVSYSGRFLDAHEKQDADRLMAVKTLTESARLLNADPAGARPMTADRVVIWNTTDGGSGGAGTSMVNVIFSLRGEEVWRKDNVSVPWEPRQDRALTMSAPASAFDRVRVEITKWVGHTGGIGEIQIMRGQQNLARGAAARVSGLFDGRFPAAAITDGVTTTVTAKTGYWLAPSGKPAWVELDVNPAAAAGRDEK